MHSCIGTLEVRYDYCYPNPYHVASDIKICPILYVL